MTEMQWIELLGKIVTVAAIASLWTWVAMYTAMAKWWTNPIGRTLVAKAVLIGMLLVPTLINLFFRLSLREKLDLAWVDIVLIGLVTPVMVWRIKVWFALMRQHSLPDAHSEDPPESAGPPVDS